MIRFHVGMFSCQVSLFGFKYSSCNDQLGSSFNHGIDHLCFLLLFRCEFRVSATFPQQEAECASNDEYDPATDR